MHSRIISLSHAREDIIDLCDIIAKHKGVLAFLGVFGTPPHRELPQRPYLAFLQEMELNTNQFRFEDSRAVLKPSEYQAALREEYNIDLPTEVAVFRLPTGVKLRTHMPYHAKLWQYAAERGAHFDIDRVPFWDRY